MTGRADDYLAQRDAIAAVVSAIPEVGRVHKRPRYGDAADHWIVTYDGIPRIRAWEIGLNAPGITATESTANHETRRVPWIIRGYIGLEDNLGDNQEIDGGGSIDQIITYGGRIADAIKADRTIGGTVLDLEQPPTVTDPVVVTVGGGSLCWGVSVTFVTWSVHP